MGPVDPKFHVWRGRPHQPFFLENEKYRLDASVSVQYGKNVQLKND